MVPLCEKRWKCIVKKEREAKTILDVLTTYKEKYNHIDN